MGAELLVELLETRGQIHRVPVHGVSETIIRTDVARGHPPRGNTDARLQLNARETPVAADPLDSEAGPKRRARVILVRDGEIEHCQQGVALKLSDNAIVLLYRFDHG